jgi:hypothetical protein
MVNLFELTGRESGIVIFDSGEIAVCRWSIEYEDTLPLTTIPYKDLEVQEEYDVDDIRKELGGTVYRDEDTGKLDTDLPIIEDKFGDIAALFGFDLKWGTILSDKPTDGRVYILSDKTKIIAPYSWV